MLLDVMAIGEMLVDIITDPYPNGLSWKFAGHPGGAPANVAIALSRLGKQAGFCGMISSDFLGEWLLGVLEQEGVDCQFVQRCAQPTTLAFVRHTNDEGEREFSFYRQNTSDICLNVGCIPESLFQSTRAIHFCSVSLSCSPARDATLYTIQKAKAAGVFISCDVNWRPLLWQDSQEGQDLIRHALRLADFVKMSEEELELLEPSKDPQLLMGSIYENQARPLWVITRGSGSATCIYEGEMISVDGYRVNAIDTTGAGDAFTGAFLSCLIDSQFTFPNRATAAEAMRYAHAAAAICVTHNGAISALPTRNEVYHLLNCDATQGSTAQKEA